MVFVERAVAIFGAKLLALVGGEGRRVLIERDQIVVAGQEQRAIGQTLDRLGLAQGAIDGIGVEVEFLPQPAQVEVLRRRLRFPWLPDPRTAH